MSENGWSVYLVRCIDGSLYCGVTNDIKRRLLEHNVGQGAKYTKSRTPVKLVGISPEMTKRDAFRLEYRIKQASADKKLTELTKEESKMTIKKDLQNLNKEIKALSTRMEKLIKEFDKSQKVGAAKKAPAKTTKRVATKKVPAKKRPAKLTATDRVLKIINRSKKGVDAATLMEKTGFDDKKIRNILQRTFHEGRIKRAARGIYVSA
ncbi:MAG: GIY-YIG nuclease family protein [Planctomycetota bacterium]|jgi:putative endonuclease